MLLTGCIGIQPAFVIARGLDEFPPPGFEIVVHRVVLQPEEPSIRIENATLTGLPVLKEILDEAVFWAQKSMNHTQHWVLGEQHSQILELLNQLYIDKYGMTSYQYAETYNTTFSGPVVDYGIYFFALAQPEGPAMIIHKVSLQETDPYLDWNNTLLESILGLKQALDTAMAWAQYNVSKILYHFEDRDAFETIPNALEQASHDKYGMPWYDVAQAHNSTLYDPVVAYGGYYFSFGWAFPEEPPILFPGLIVLTVTIVLIGIIILSITLLNFRRIRSELAIKPRVAFKRYMGFI
jgi:hypothetical protein